MQVKCSPISESVWYNEIGARSAAVRVYDE